MKQRIPMGAALVTPGEILAEEFLQPLGLSHRALARRMGVNPMRVNEIVHGKRAITADTALRLAGVLGTSARFWMNLQTNFDLARAPSVVQSQRDCISQPRVARLRATLGIAIKNQFNPEGVA
jgi:addiction module HigA family antidote